MEARVKQLCFALAVFVVVAAAIPSVNAHFTMILPGTTNPSAKDFMVSVGETKTFWVLWGHPFEHALFDAPTPEVHVLDPEGNVAEVEVTPITVEGSKAWQFTYTFTKMGDYVIYVDLLAVEHETWDHVKTIVHCGGEVWEGWDQSTGQRAEVIPYVRPYGLEEGFVYSGKALFDGSPMSRADVEVEKYHTAEVAEALVSVAEEEFQPNPSCVYTRLMKTNEDGEFAFTLDEPGVWYIGVYGPTEVVEGHEVQHRAVLQVVVDEAFGAPSTINKLSQDVSGLSTRLAQLESTVASFSPGLVYAALALSVIALVLAIVLPFALRRR